MKIQVTRNYDKFELLAFNRDVKRTTALERSMERYGWIDAYPMHVVPNGGVKLKIKAGHHRFTVAKKLGLPIKYVVCKDQGETIHELEVATTPWTLKNYLDSFVRCERPDYISVKEYHEKTGINLSQCISMLGGDLASSHNMGKKFKDGTYKVKEWGHANNVASIIFSMKENGVSWATNRFLVQALSKALVADGFSAAILKKKIKKFPELIQKQPNAEAYLNMLEEIYNHFSKTRYPLAFFANEAARKRSAVGR